MLLSSKAHSLLSHTKFQSGLNGKWKTVNPYMRLSVSALQFKAPPSAWHQEICCIPFTACSQPQSGIHPCLNTATHSSTNCLTRQRLFFHMRVCLIHPSGHTAHVESFNYPYWQHCRLSGSGAQWTSGCEFPAGAAPGIWNKWWHIIVCRLQTYILISLHAPSHYCCCLWMAYASYSLTVCVDVEMTQM